MSHKCFSPQSAVLFRNASLNYVFEAPNAEDLRHSIKRRLGKASHESRSEHNRIPPKGQAWAKYHLPGHDLVGTAAWGQEYVDSTTSYCTVPMTMSCDLASKDRPDGIQYRVGMHQVSLFFLTCCTHVIC